MLLQCEILYILFTALISNLFIENFKILWYKCFGVFSFRGFHYDTLPLQFNVGFLKSRKECFKCTSFVQFYTITEIARL